MSKCYVCQKEAVGHPLLQSIDHAHGKKPCYPPQEFDRVRIFLRHVSIDLMGSSIGREAQELLEHFGGKDLLSQPQNQGDPA